MPPRYGEFVWSNGTILPTATLCLASTNRGLLYGDGVFTTLKLEDGKLYDVNAHTKQLQAQCDTIGIDLEANDTPYPITDGSNRHGNLKMESAIRIPTIKELQDLYLANVGMLDDARSSSSNYYSESGMLPKNKASMGGFPTAGTESEHKNRSATSFRVKIIVTGGSPSDYGSHSFPIELSMTRRPASNVIVTFMESSYSGIAKLMSLSDYSPSLTPPYGPIVLAVFSRPISPINRLLSKVKSLTIMQRFALRHAITEDDAQAIGASDIVCTDINACVLETIFSNIFWVLPPSEAPDTSGIKLQKRASNTETKNLVSPKVISEIIGDGNHQTGEFDAGEHKVEEGSEKIEAPRFNSNFSIESEFFRLQCPSRVLDLYFGVTLSTICRAVQSSLGAEVEEVKVTLEDIPASAYVFICNSLKEIVPVKQIGSRRFRVSPKLEAKLWAAYLQELEIVDMVPGKISAKMH